jgi:hypothetical protein
VAPPNVKLTSKKIENLKFEIELFKIPVGQKIALKTIRKNMDNFEDFYPKEANKYKLDKINS